MANRPGQPYFQHFGFQGEIGIHRFDITPPVGITVRNWGAAKHQVAEGIHRPLTGTTLVLSSAGDTVVIVGLDLGWWRSKADEWALRSAVLSAGGLSEVQLLISLSHTHAGPSICRADEDRPGGEFVGPYLDMVRDGVIQSVQTAIREKQPARLEWEIGHCEVAQNRDLREPGTERFLCGFNPTSADTDGTAQRDGQRIGVGRITALTGQLLGTVVHYACHPTVLAWENKLISPDFVGSLRETVEHATDAPCLYLQGASGELGAREQYTADLSVADRVGRAIGYSALGVLESMLPAGKALEYSGVTESGAPLATFNHVDVAYKSEVKAKKKLVPLSLKDLPSLDEIDLELSQDLDPAFAERLRRKRQVREYVGDGNQMELPIFTARTGDIRWVGVPGEAYSSLQHRLVEAEDPPTVVMNITNGWYGYFPPADLYEEDIYPVWQTPFASGCLERITDSLLTDNVESGLDL